MARAQQRVAARGAHALTVGAWLVVVAALVRCSHAAPGSTHVAGDMTGMPSDGGRVVDASSGACLAGKDVKPLWKSPTPMCEMVSRLGMCSAPLRLYGTATRVLTASGGRALVIDVNAPQGYYCPHVNASDPATYPQVCPPTPACQSQR